MPNIHDWFMYFHSTFFFVHPGAISFLLTSWHHLAPSPRPTNPSPGSGYITANVGSLRVASHSTIITRFQVTTCNYRSAAALGGRCILVTSGKGKKCVYWCKLSQNTVLSNVWKWKVCKNNRFKYPIITFLSICYCHSVKSQHVFPLFGLQVRCCPSHASLPRMAWLHIWTVSFKVSVNRQRIGNSVTWGKWSGTCGTHYLHITARNRTEVSQAEKSPVCKGFFFSSFNEF